MALTCKQLEWTGESAKVKVQTDSLGRGIGDCTGTYDNAPRHEFGEMLMRSMSNRTYVCERTLILSCSCARARICACRPN